MFEFFVPCLNFWEEHCRPDWTPWRTGFGPGAILWRPCSKHLKLFVPLANIHFMWFLVLKDPFKVLKESAIHGMVCVL